jgi:hypothetical protein
MVRVSSWRVDEFPDFLICKEFYRDWGSIRGECRIIGLMLSVFGRVLFFGPN